MITWGLVYWPKYLIVGSLFFILPELFALITNVNNTLSDYCWKELNVSLAYGTGQHTIAWWLSLVAWLLFFVAITIHIWWRGV